MTLHINMVAIDPSPFVNNRQVGRPTTFAVARPTKSTFAGRHRALGVAVELNPDTRHCCSPEETAGHSGGRPAPRENPEGLVPRAKKTQGHRTRGTHLKKRLQVWPTSIIWFSLLFTRRIKSVLKELLAYTIALHVFFANQSSHRRFRPRTRPKTWVSQLVSRRR